MTEMVLMIAHSDYCSRSVEKRAEEGAWVLDRFEDLRTFVALVQTGGFNAAAERLNIVKSAVSRRIRDLERRLDVRLVHRTTRKISLTDAGRAYYKRSIDILNALDSLDESARIESREPAGTIRLSAPVSFSIHCLAQAVAAFQSRYQSISVEIDANDRFADLVHDGYDLAVRIARLKDSGLIARRIVTIRHLLCASPAYLARHGRPADLDELKEHWGIVYAYKEEDAYWTFADGVVARPKSRLRLNNGDIMREAAIAGAGLVYLPSFVVAEAIAVGALETILEGSERPPIAMYAVFPASQHLPARVRLFIDFLVEEFGDNPRWDRLIAQSRLGAL